MTKEQLRKPSPRDGLHESSLLRTLIDSLPDQVYVKDTEGRYLLSNLEHAKALGATSPEEIAGKTDSDFYPSQLVERYRADEREVVELGLPLVDKEEPSVDEEGNERWHASTKVPLRDGSGEIVGLAGLTRDITNHKWAEDALQKSEENLAEAQRMARLGSWEWNTKTGEVSWSEEVFRIYGIVPDEFVPTLDKLMEVVHPDDQELVTKRVRAALRENEPYDFEHRIVRPDGEVRVVHRRAEVVFDEEGEPLRIIGTVHDITEGKQAEEKLKESEKRFRSLTQNATDLITVLEEDGTIRYESPTVERILGYLPEERIGKNAFDYLHPDDEDSSKATFAEALDNPGQVQPPVELRLRHKDGSWRCVETTRTNLLNDPAVKGVVANSRDITERRRTEEALRESEERFRTAFEDAPIGVALVGLDRSHVKVNRAYCAMLGYTEEELLAKPHPEIIHPDDREESADRIQGILGQGAEPYALERRYFHADGHMVWSLSNISLIRDSEGKPSHFVCLHEDITERKELEEQLRHQAFYDSLTDLPNRSLFLDRLDHALARAGREGGPIAVLLIDLDDFKIVNDSLGHDAGNAVLVEVAERLQASVRPGDTVGRIFGDEFAVLLEASAGEEEACRVTERIQEGLQAPFEVDRQEVFVRASIGVALGETDEDQPNELLRHADLAMYEAKNAGNVRYEVYNPSMDTRLVERMNLERDLSRAVEREEFEVHYQPKVLLETGEIIGVEALVRWRHPDGDLLEASQFILPAEETGLIDQIGLWVLKESCCQLKEWQERYPTKVGLPFGLCVNLSAREIWQPDLAEKVAGVLQETGLDPACLMLEITERTAKKDAEQTIAKLRELKELGVKLAIDDFGTGYCSLLYLEHTLLDILKIDRLIVHRERKDPEESDAILSAMTSMAHSLNLEVIVEGVETEEQVTKLKEMGCEMAQGHYFAEPLPSEGAERLLKEGFSRQKRPSGC
jgi:diguanylate cyclase (GGDEF)-like protein/PAS domain S-box-containing protein